MGDGYAAARVLAELWESIETQQWDRIFDLLDPAVQIRYVHTGEDFDASSFVELNRDYPGRWHASVDDLIGAGDRAASRTYVTDGTQGHWAASFATTSGGRITELVEVWTEAGQLPPPGRPAG